MCFSKYLSNTANFSNFLLQRIFYLKSQCVGLSCDQIKKKYIYKCTCDARRSTEISQVYYYDAWGTTRAYSVHNHPLCPVYAVFMCVYVIIMTTTYTERF